MSYVYETCCVDYRGPVEELTRMTRSAKRVSYETMLKHCPTVREWAFCHGYGKTKRSVFPPIKHDFAVSYHKSTFEGRACYYLRWSAIEFIWVKR